ncbi:hypothetical protein AABB24_033765 [Solanum stoloniferum]|uniref:Uncharacterized protein n=1 Tax=Solanum stoloniferum TaxID=62892 RepID=A0ABD2RCK2_9SOLN
MDILINVLSGLIVEVGKFVGKCIFPYVENTVHFSSNVENLTKEMETLAKLRDDIKGKVEKAEGEGYKPKPDVIKWIDDVRELENEWETMQENIAAAKTLPYSCCPNCSLLSQVWTQAQNSIQVKLCSLKNGGESFGSNLMEENYRMEKVEHLPGPSIKDQPAARKNLDKILQHLENDEVCIIGVWGAGGIGKTTLVTNLNNELKQIDVSIRSKLSFGVVIWVTVPKPPIDIRKVQAQIVSRLNLKVDNEGSEMSIASKIYQRLKQEKSFLVILDDVWEAIDLDHVGVPQLKGSKVIITSRDLGVCNQMKIDTEMNISTLDEDESWHMFIKNAGDVAKQEDIQPLAMDIVRECGGLPLAITVIGTSMRGKNRVELWEDALKSLRISTPNNKEVEKKVYNVIKWSFDSLESQDDIELSSEYVMNKKRGDIRSCFLYCSLYPAAMPTNDLIHCWWGEGFLGEHDTYEEAYNRGITMIESLKDACLLEEADKVDYVKMHDVVRDVAIWIDKSISHNAKRMSFIGKKIEHLTECPETTTLLLQDYYSLREIPHEFFLSFPALRVLNLSRTGIRALPSSVKNLSQLRALILGYCYELKKLPAIGKSLQFAIA